MEAKGDCYYASGQLIMRDFLNKIDYKGTPYLVHAEVQGQGEISDIRFGHSWIEDEDMVYDYSNNRELQIPKHIYYLMGDVKTDNPKKYRKYTFDEARAKMVESGHYGCWDLETEYVKGGKINPIYFDGYIITRFEAPSKYNFREYKNEVFKGTYTRFYAKRSGKRELNELLNGYDGFKLISDNVDKYGGWWLFEKHNNEYNKSIVIVESSSIMEKGGKIDKDERLKYLIERRDEELNNLVKLGRNTIDEKRKIIDYYDERMKKENLFSKGGKIVTANVKFFDKDGGSIKAHYTYKNGGVVVSYDEGGEIQDTCYVNYVGYEIQNKRCKREGIDFFMLGEYRDVARNLRETHTSEWIYYNRMARLFISPQQAKQFVEEANEFLRPLIKVNGYFVEVDRSFALYKVRTSQPMGEQELNTNLGRSETRQPQLDKIAEKRRYEQQQEKEFRREKAEKPIAYPSQWRKVNGRWWWIGLMVNVGGQGDYGDDKWKNTKLNEHIPHNEGISVMTLIHEYAHCLDFNQSIEDDRVYERPYGEMMALSKTDFFGNPIPKHELKQIKELQKRGVKDITLLSSHEENFVKALSKILRGGMSNGIPILNKIEEEAHQIEKKVGGESYANEKRQQAMDDFLLKMKKSVEKANIPHLNVRLSDEIKKHIATTENAYILQLAQKDIDKEVGMKLLPTLSRYKDEIKENMYVNPTKNGKILSDIRKIEKDINRLISRT